MMEGIFMKRIFAISFFIFLIDIISKCIMMNVVSVGDSIIVIPHFFSFTLAYNTGVAFSMLDGYGFLIILFTIIVILGILWYLKYHAVFGIERVGYAFIIGGAFGNLVDRFVYGHVIDFLDFVVFGYDFPVFNLADSAIVIGVILLFFVSFKKGGDKS